MSVFYGKRPHMRLVKLLLNGRASGHSADVLH
jgi:hypothetical protein